MLVLLNAISKKEQPNHVIFSFINQLKKSNYAFFNLQIRKPQSILSYSTQTQKDTTNKMKRRDVHIC